MTDTLLTHYVASFITNTAFTDLPAHALAMSKKSFLDGIGLAFAGSVAESGALIRRRLQNRPEHRLHFAPTRRRHWTGPASICCISHSRAVLHSRFTVAGDTPSTSAVSSTVSPPK